MKQQDIAIIIIVVFFTGIFAFFISNKFITPADSKQTAEVVQPIRPEFPVPDNSVFNGDAINPTVRIEIAPNDNKKPFTNAQ